MRIFPAILFQNESIVVRWFRITAMFVAIVLGGLWHCSPANPTNRPKITVIPAGGYVTPGTEVRLESDRPATLYYTLDETYPTPETGLRYQAPFKVWSHVVLRVVAYDAEQQPGAETRVWFAVDSLFPQTSVTPCGGNFHDRVDLVLKADEESNIYYTLDGTEPTLQSPLYSGPLRITKDTMLRFFGVDPWGNREPTQQEEYNFSPRIETVPLSGIYQQHPLQVSIVANETKAVVSFNVLSSRLGWQIYKEPLSFSYDTHLQVRAEDEKGWLSLVEERMYSLIQPFVSRPMVVGIDEPLAVATVDPEGFDRSSLVVATRDHLWVVVQNEQGFDTPRKVASLPFATQWIRVWDLDGDGLSDVMLGDADGKLYVFRGSAGATWVADSAILASVSSALVQRVVPLDFDADGQLDLLILDRRAGQSRLVRRTPEGYQAQTPLGTWIGANTKEVLAGDFNNDRKVDLLILPQASETPYVLLGDGKGQFRSASLQPVLSSFPPHTEWLHAMRTDMNGDGELDFVLVGRSPAVSGQEAALQVVLLQHLDGEYWRKEATLTLPDAPVRGCMPVDFDSDGYPDLVIWLQNQPPVLINNFLGKRLFVVEDQHIPETMSSAAVGTVGHFNDRGVHSLWWAKSSSWSSLTPQGNPRFLHLLLQGIRGNRNAIGTQIRMLTTTSPFVREIGIRSTGPDQSSLFFPIPFDNNTVLQSLRIFWSDGQTLEIPQPTFNQAVVIRPH